MGEGAAQLVREEGSGDPELLSPDVVALLREPETAAGWLEMNRERIPAGLLPAGPAVPFANLFCSFFSTSFRVRHLEFEDRLLDSRLRAYPSRPERDPICAWNPSILSLLG